MLGLIDMTDEQRVQAALDQAFPNPEHRQIVEYQGKQYRCRFFPMQKCRSGWAVKKWGKCWESIEG